MSALRSVGVSDAEFERAAGAVVTGLILPYHMAVKKNWLGRPKPSSSQKGYLFGFSTAFANSVGITSFTDDTAFNVVVFIGIFGKTGGKILGDVVGNIPEHSPSISLGGAAFRAWRDHGHPPLPPLY